jgi:hypothetical protein
MEYDLIEQIYNLVLIDTRITKDFKIELVREAKAFVLENDTDGRFIISIERD